jgi:hypothetical protein
MEQIQLEHTIVDEIKKKSELYFVPLKKKPRT